MRRRDFIAALGAATTWACSSPCSAQSSRLPVVGVLSNSSPNGIAHGLSGFHQGLKDEGLVENQHLTIEYRWTLGRPDRLPSLASELVERNVAAIAAFGPPASLAAKAATSTIPIVFTSGGDVVRQGLVTSLNRPGGNATGLNLFTQAATPKRVELIDKLVPAPASLAFLLNPRNPAATGTTQAVQRAATTLNRQLQVFDAATESEIEGAFEAMTRQKIAGVIVNTDQFYDEVHFDKIIGLAARTRLPTIYGQRSYVLNGGLISYGTSIVDAYRQVGAYIGRILKGEKPSDLPVVQPARFEFAVNLKTAKALGLEIPPTLLIFADELIE
jgi:putative tryptophan/tyrosine transport system substrate-binding protein